MESPTSASKIRTGLANNKVSDSNESDGEKSTPRGGHLDMVPRDRKLPSLARTGELKPIDFPLRSPNDSLKQESTEVKKLKKKKQKKNKKQKEKNEQQENGDE
ncbi:uncharacterized protein LOC117341421 [Pecten maximus]|uniref:uncharacterized protein LOC117341421 n=1 Tax=Pecten maximus TaxID=6579 RepID=UPI0014584B03|nr:uncharacterized protein LOC117341421 [Pecten maximus]